MLPLDTEQKRQGSYLSCNNERSVLSVLHYMLFVYHIRMFLNRYLEELSRNSIKERVSNLHSY